MKDCGVALRSKGGRCLFCHKREETKDGDLVLALDVMTQTPIVASPSDVRIERGRGEELQKKNTGSGDCVLCL